MVRIGIPQVLTLVFPMLLWGTPADPPPQQEKKIIVEPKPARQGWLGIQIQDMTAEQAKEMKIASEEGALVTEVTPDSPADKGGIKKDDVVVEFNGRTIYDGDDLMKAVRRAKPGTTAAVVVQRKDGKKNLQVTVGKMKRNTWSLGALPRPAAPKLRFFHAGMTCGMQLADLNPQLGEYFGAPGGKGVLVEEVEKESEGEKAGFKAGDVILRIGDEKIEDIGDVTDALEDFKEGEKANVEILRKGSRQTLSLTIDENELSTGPMSPDAQRALREDLRKAHESLDKVREEYGPEFRKRLREELREIREDLGPEFQKQMKKLQHELQEAGARMHLELGRLRARHAIPPRTI